MNSRHAASSDDCEMDLLAELVKMIEDRKKDLLCFLLVLEELDIIHYQYIHMLVEV